jgi:hypothetical protein
MINRKTVGLITFLRGSSLPSDQMPGCANYDFDRDGCLFEDTGCKVEKNKRCGYFERAVLPTAKDIGLQELVNDLYAEATGFISKPVKNIRRCSCGEALMPRQRSCEKCLRNRRKSTYRQKRDNRKSYAQQLS